MTTTTKQMNAARKAIKAAVAERGNDSSHMHRVAIDTLTASGMKDCIVTEMAWHAVLDVALSR